jgi:hypothetical protein
MTLEKYAPSNNEMKRTKPAMITVARSSPLISVFGGQAWVARIIEE